MEAIGTMPSPWRTLGLPLSLKLSHSAHVHCMSTVCDQKWVRSPCSGHFLFSFFSFKVQSPNLHQLLSVVPVMAGPRVLGLKDIPLPTHSIPCRIGASRLQTSYSLPSPLLSHRTSALRALRDHLGWQPSACVRFSELIKASYRDFDKYRKVKIRCNHSSTS